MQALSRVRPRHPCTEITIGRQSAKAKRSDWVGGALDLPVRVSGIDELHSTLLQIRVPNDGVPEIRLEHAVNADQR